MFKLLVSAPIHLLSLSAESHNILNATMMSDIARIMEKRDWTCHQCHIRIPNLMEVDHVGGHSPQAKEKIEPICQFCHDRKHPLWAGSRHRLVALHAPDLSDEDVSRISWSLILHTGRDGFSIDRAKLKRDLIARREDAQDALGHSNLESVFEAFMTMLRGKDKDAMLALAEEIDRDIKFFPSILFSDSQDVQVWKRGGFRSLEDGWREEAHSPKLPAYSALKAAGQGFMGKL